MNKKELKAILKISRKEYEIYNKYLSDGHIETFKLPKKSTLYFKLVKFENESELSFEIFTGTENVMCTLYLTDKNGNELKTLTYDEGMDMSYEIDTDNYNYRLDIEIED